MSKLIIKGLFFGLLYLVAILQLTSHIAIAAQSPDIDCKILPPNNIWNHPIDKLPVHRNSKSYIRSIGLHQKLKGDFGSGKWPPVFGGPIGIPYVIVSNKQKLANIIFQYSEESDSGPYPIPDNAPIEGGPDSMGDRHIIVLNRDTCMLYEIFNAFQEGKGRWRAGSGAIFNLNSNALRPNGWTSADAAGLPILPGLVRYEDIERGEIKHALRFTARKTQRAYVWPARHHASTITDKTFPPLGQRFRLRQDFNIQGFSKTNQVILRALKTYGMILADNGAPWFLTGSPDSRWDNEDIAQLGKVQGKDFEAVNVYSLMESENSGKVRMN